MFEYRSQRAYCLKHEGSIARIACMSKRLKVKDVSTATSDIFCGKSSNWSSWHQKIG